MPDSEFKVKTFPIWKTVLFSFKLIWSISKIQVVIMFTNIIYYGLKGTVFAAMNALVIDQAIKLVSAPQKSTLDLVPLIGLYITYGVVTGALDRVINYRELAFSFKSGLEINRMNIQKIESLGIDTLENPRNQNLQQKASDNFDTLTRYADRVIHVLTEFTRVIAAGVSFALVFPPGLLIMILVSLPAFIIDSHFIKKNWRYQLDNTEARRRGYSNVKYMQDTRYIPEVSILGARKFLLDKYFGTVKPIIVENTKLYKRWYLIGFTFDMLSQITLYINYGYILWQLILGVISLGQFTFFRSAADNFFYAVGNLMNGITRLRESKQQIEPFMELMELERLYAEGTVELPRLVEGPAIELRNVDFAYPEASTKVFENLDLSIRAGEKIAIVGHNGAGKTTLVKLLCRLYKVNRGDVLINGHSISDLKADDWYKNIGALFQDYNTYNHLTVRENISIGRTSKPENIERVIEAARAADAEDFINEFPNKFEQLLSEKFKGGIRPSTGQWQKIAIARFFYRNPALVIFDEPTAAIDAVSEYKIFNKIYEFFTGKTVIIISHRFSTVRNADRILVVEKGKIIEEGNHEQLIALNGTYAHAFKLQAEGYQT